MPVTHPTAAATPQRDVAALLDAHDGVLTRGQLAAVGYGRDRVAAQVRAGRWRLVGLAVVAHRGPLSDAQRARVAVAQTRGRGALCAWSGLELAGLRGWGRDRIHVVVPRGWTVWRLPRLVVHESRRFDRAVDVTGPPGLERTAPARSAVDAAAWSTSVRSAVGVVAATAQQGLCRPSDLADALRSAGRVRHVAALRRAIADIGGGAESLAELDLAPLLVRAGLPRPRRQVVRTDASGRRRYVDAEVALGSVVLMIEVDGAHHLDVDQAWADQRRQNDLVGPGRVVLRFSAFAVRHEPEQVVRQLRDVAARYRT